MPSLFDQPVLGGLFSVESAPEREALNMGLLGLGLGMLESGRFGPGLQNFQSLYQSGLAAGEKREEKEAERKRQEQLAQDYQTLLGGAPAGGTQVADASGAAPASPGMDLTPEQRAILATLPPEQGIPILAQQAFRPGPQPTDDIREYEFARSQGYQGSFTDFMRDMRRAGATSVSVDARNLGSIPPGFRLVEDESGLRMEAIPGSPAAQEQEAAAAAKQAQQGQAAQYGNVVLTDIKRVQDKIQNSVLPTTGFIGNFLKNIGGTAAADVRALTDTIRANIGFDRLQAMRDASPTGGALGQVTERELAFLQSTLGSLEQSQSEEQLLENLDRLEKIYTDVLRKASAYPNAAQFGFDQPAAPTTGATPLPVPPSGEWQDLGNGVRIRRVQ